MKKFLVILLVFLPIISGLYLAPVIVRPAHAALVGEVCIVRVSDAGCLPTPPTIAGPPPGLNSHFYVRVLVNSSDSLNGFDITLFTDHTILSPADVKLGTINLGASTELVKCIGGVNKIGTTPCPFTDNANTLHYSVSGSITPSKPVTDVLFTANYTVVANSANTPIRFQTGCTGTSVAGGVCVLITNGSTSAVPETSLTAKFSNSAYFDIEANIGTLTVSKGDVDSTPFLTITSLNNFGSPVPGTVNLSGSSSPAGPIVTVSPNSVTLTNMAPLDSTIAGITVNVTKTVPPGTYALNITGTSGSLPPNVITIILTVPKPDFSLTPTPANLFFNVTVPGKSKITISSIGNFNGTVALSLPPVPPSGITASLLNSTLKLSSKGTNMTTLTVNATQAGVYSLNITATSGALKHTVQLSITVFDYFLHVDNPGVLTVLNGTTVTKTIAVNPTGFYNVTVTIGNLYIDQISPNGINGPSNGISVSCSPTRLTITSTGNTNGQNSTNCNVKGQAVGNYIVTVTAMSGSDGHTSNHALSFQVSVVRPNFSIILPSTITTVSVGTSTSFVVVVAGNNRLADNITVGFTISGGNPSQFFGLATNASIVRLTSTSPNATILVTITSSQTTPPGQYSLTVEGTGKVSNPLVVDAKLSFVVVTTSSPHDLAVYSVTPSATSVTLGSKVNITIVVQNLGKLTENATIVAIVGDQSIGSQNRTLAPGQNTTATITWDTSKYNPGAYMVGGKVLGVPGETILSNNLLRSPTPVTLNSANTSILTSPYTIPAIIIAAIIVIAAGLAIYFLPRRKTQTS